MNQGTVTTVMGTAWESALHVRLAFEAKVLEHAVESKVRVTSHARRGGVTTGSTPNGVDA
ncbi:MAG: hypothetical protein HZY75_06570 [Nocardioidaceae bacterium]|nr:MAG: hypothetical protein HZY75_06570 [Nocardioidaceae bacterium]